MMQVMSSGRGRGLFEVVIESRETWSVNSEQLQRSVTGKWLYGSRCGRTWAEMQSTLVTPGHERVRVERVVPGYISWSGISGGHCHLSLNGSGSGSGHLPHVMACAKYLMFNASTLLFGLSMCEPWYLLLSAPCACACGRRTFAESSLDVAYCDAHH